jgi:hypothetical protein
MTGTPLDLTPFGGIVTGIGWLYWLIALGLLVLALRRPKTPRRKAFWTLLVVLVFGLMPGIQLREAYVANAKLRAATAQFEMRCRSAGEKISRVAENVEGVVWLKWRDKARNESDQFKLDDPYGQDCTGVDCIEQLLRITSGLELDPNRKQPRLFGYQFVESKSPADGLTYRYTLNLYRPHDRDPKWLETHVQTELLKQPIDRPAARYGITWDDISTREDREHWIAGGSLKVIDLQTDEVIAERIGYMMDRGLGNRFNGRSPWVWARGHACPPFPGGRGQRSWPNTETLNFASKVLQPAREGLHK